MVAMLLVGGGTLWLLAAVDLVTLSGQDALALGLLATGLGLLVAAWWGRAYALIPIGLVLASLLLLDDLVDVPLDAGTGDRTTVVDSRQEVGERHELFAGELTLDLTEAPLSDIRSTTVEASVGMGQLHVVVPDNATVEVDAATAAGEILSPAAGIDEGGVDIGESFMLEGDRDGPRLELDLSVGLGNVEVFRG
jgi:Cell wall-active antibiotics response 4TMS YvqF